MKKSPYLAFTSLGYRILHCVATLGFIMIGFLANIYIGSVGVVLISAGISKFQKTKEYAVCKIFLQRLQLF